MKMSKNDDDRDGDAMNPQQVFDKVALHLLTQNKKSITLGLAGPGCAYRGAGNTSCAVGCLIKDEHYDPALEGCGIHGAALRNAVAKSIGVDALSLEMEDMLQGLQCVHDNRQPSGWREALREVGLDCGLNVEVLAPPR